MDTAISVDLRTRPNYDELEKQVLQFWDDNNTFERSVSERPADKTYIFYDGPPFATGLPHYGHLLASTVKDVIPRYWTMKGFRVDRVWGWDCHGVPIENMIEKELALEGGKKGIEAYGIGNFNNACRSAILRFDKEWERIIKRIGRWVDFKNSYKTMDNTYIESVWWAFKTLWEKGHVYQGKKVILYCPRCSTPLSNFEIAMDNSYKNVVEPSTTYKYPVVGQKDTYLLAWSTTPWNKLATPALAVNPLMTYVKVKQGEGQYILAESRLSMLKQEIPYTVIEKYTGKELESLAFEPHFSYFPPAADEKSGVVVADTFVTDEDGTGIVTLAIYGEDDYRVMSEHHIQQIEHVDEQGRLKPEVTDWAGMDILKANPLIDEALDKRGLIYEHKRHSHSVATCYRCSTRLYFAPLPAWFINIQNLKPQLLKLNEQINWYPGHLKNGRFGKGLASAPDWNISRSRYWGSPMPIWTDKKTGRMRIIGSVAELKQWAVDPSKAEAVTDLHREFLDPIEVWIDDEKTIKGSRIPEVFDCWIESGSMPFASIKYPFQNKDTFEASYPAQFITEYIAQTRAWFYTLHVLSTALFGKPAFENAVTTGTILAEDGTKMSKSKKNYPDPMLLVEKYGVDPLRMYLMNSVVMKADNVNFAEQGVLEMKRKALDLWWNMLSFYQLYADTSSDVSTLPAKDSLKHPLDQWLVAFMEESTASITVAMDSYDTITTTNILLSVIQELSTWYLRLSRNRVREGGDAAKQPSHVLGASLYRLGLLCAPFMPFFAETAFHILRPNDSKNSIHLQMWPEAQPTNLDTQLLDQMKIVGTVIEQIRAQRQAAKLRTRQPLASVEVVAQSAVDDSLMILIKEEGNVENVNWKTDKNEQLSVTLDMNITPELKEKGEAREIIRQIQDLRKEKGVSFTEVVKEVSLPSWPKAHEESILKKARVQKLTVGELSLIQV